MRQESLLSNHERYPRIEANANNIKQGEWSLADGEPLLTFTQDCVARSAPIVRKIAQSEFCCCYQSNAYPELTRANVRVVDHFILCFFGTDSIDCGVTACSCCNGPGCIRLGTATSFVVCLSLVAFVSGGIESYFRLAAHQAASELSFDPIVLDWLLVTAGVAQGLFALLVSYWGNRFHRISWLGGIFMLQAISLIVLIIPTLTHK